MPKPAKLPADLLLILIWIMLTIIFILTPSPIANFVRIILGIPMLLFIPGYVLIAALFPGKDDLEGTERIALSFGLSIAIIPILGLLLNFSVGIRLLTILITLCIYTAVLLLIAAFIREKLPVYDQFSVPFYKIFEIVNKEFVNSQSNMDRILIAILIFSIVIEIGMIISVIITPKTGERFTEFYILGSGGKTENYSTNLKYNSPARILVGVVNHEYVPVNYTIEVTLNGNLLANTNFNLDNNRTWEKNETFVPDMIGRDMKLEFLLFKENNFSSAYRELHLWVNVTK